MTRKRRETRPRRVHLGDRLAIIDRIRRGAHTLEQAAEDAGVPVNEVERWMTIHADDRIVRIEDVWIPADVKELTLRAQRLLDLIDTADADIRAMVQELSAKNGSSRNLE